MLFKLAQHLALSASLAIVLEAVRRYAKRRKELDNANCTTITNYAPYTPPWLAAALAADPDALKQQLRAMLKEILGMGEAGLEALDPDRRRPAPAFGHETRQQLFCLRPSVAYLNHGSYGAATKSAVKSQARFSANIRYRHLSLSW